MQQYLNHQINFVNQYVACSSIYIWMIHMANLYIIVMMQATELAVVCQMIESKLFGSLLLFHGVHACSIWFCYSYSFD